ncbi:MAG: protein kinase [Thermoanaerobaculia bacterium]
MPLAPGTRLGPYEILSPLGAGGMGEVYRARDSRLGRDVAVKVLPQEVAGDPNALSRFESEAKAVAALSHPGILSIFDVGESNGTRFAVTELLEGDPLRALVARGPVPVRRALEIAQEVADGLAAAHEKGIVHRDLTPENVFLTRDGRAKILDFGLSRRDAPFRGIDDSRAPALSARTEPGIVVGTASYMSPEQARGLPVDFRSDQFSLGVLLYEMLSGRRPFHGTSAVETLNTILREEPEPLSRRVPALPPPVAWIVDRCLAKDPRERFASTEDLRRDLETCRAHLSELTSAPAGTAGPAARAGRSRRVLLGAAGFAAAVVALFAGVLAWRSPATRPEPRFQRLTFRRGSVWSARFAPDGRTIVYSAGWNGGPIDVFSARLDGPESRSLAFPRAVLLAVSRASDLALALESRLTGNFRTGTLARVSISGGAPRPLDERIPFADFSPDGTEMALARETDGGLQLEYPAGKVLYRAAPGWLSEPRVSPSGDLVAFLEHPGADDLGWVAVVDRAGRKRRLAGPFFRAIGLAWSPDGNEVWFTAARAGSRMELRAVTLGGRERLLFGQLAPLILQDVSADGRALVMNVAEGSRMFFRGEGDDSDRDLSWLDNPWPLDITPDGRLVNFLEAGQGAGATFQIYVRETNGAPAMRLGPGFPSSLSPDGRFVVAPQQDAETIAVYPIGPGSSKTVTLKGFNVRQAGLLPDGRTLWFTGRKMPGGPRAWLTDLSGTAPRPVTPELRRPEGRMTPDGRHFLGAGDRGLELFPVDGGEPRLVHGLSDDDFVCGISADSRSFYVQRGHEIPARLRRVDVDTGESEVVRELVPADPAGALALKILATPDGKKVTYGLSYFLSDLYLIEGMR